jgi:hypothetical protein
MKKILLITLVFILAACSAGGSEFSRNQKKWTDANIQHYRFELNISCFCAFRDQMPLKVEVQNGEVVSITAQDGSLIEATNPNYEYFAPYATIDKLFGELQADLNGKAEAVTVKYDPTHGFPTEITIDYQLQAADDELYLYASALEKLP